MARNPEHETIQIVATDYQADAIERLFAPNLTLVQMPLEMLAQAEGGVREDDLPTYFFGLTEEGAAKAFGPRPMATDAASTNQPEQDPTKEEGTT